MKTRLELIFGILFLTTFGALAAGIALFLFNITRALHPFIVNNIGHIIWISIVLFLLIITMRNLRRDYELYTFDGTSWKLQGTFDSVSSIHQYIDEHEELQFSDYKFKPVKHA